MPAASSAGCDRSGHQATVDDVDTCPANQTRCVSSPTPPTSFRTGNLPDGAAAAAPCGTSYASPPAYAAYDIRGSVARSHSSSSSSTTSGGATTTTDADAAHALDLPRRLQIKSPTRARRASKNRGDVPPARRPSKFRGGQQPGGTRRDDDDASKNPKNETKCRCSECHDKRRRRRRTMRTNRRRTHTHTVLKGDFHCDTQGTA